MIAPEPLTGYTVGVTAVARRLEIGAAVEHHGARVVYAALHEPDGPGWVAPRDRDPADRLVRGLVDRGIDALVVVEPAAATGLLELAGRRRARLVETLVDDVVVLALDAAVASPLREVGVPVQTPPRARLAALVRLAVHDVPARRGLHLVAAGHRLDVRGHLALVDGVPMALDQAAAEALRRLAGRPGHGISLSRELVDRLRHQLGDSRLILAAGRSSFRLAVDVDGLPAPQPAELDALRAPRHDELGSPHGA